MGSTERSCCPGLRPCYGGFNHAVDLYHTPAARWASFESLTKHRMLHSSQHSTARVVFTLGSFVSPRVQLFPISLYLLLCCHHCSLLMWSAVCLCSPSTTKCSSTSIVRKCEKCHCDAWKSKENCTSKPEPQMMSGYMNLSSCRKEILWHSYYQILA